MSPHSKKKTPPSQDPPPPTPNMEKLKQFVRARAEEFLNDPNISSVGIGYKIKDGVETQTISIQFSVGEKVLPEHLESVGSHIIPASFEIDGVEVPTDVIQRSYVPSYRILAEPERHTNPRKIRINPVMGGVSVAHHKETAGTLGCIVYDRQTGTPYILSNWHVLHGPTGKVGDDIMQPGPHDDNRLSLNRLGQLVRSHLGHAGDAAVASIQDRGFAPEIYGINTKPTQLGEPELGDKVIKSGRTTNVTYGIVQRIHTMVKLDYGHPVGYRTVGGFEIGVDPAHRPSNGEISMGGDSGSVWLFREGNKTTQVLAGLHFAGEGPSDPNEHAIACYAASVFEKLEISLQPPHTNDPVTPGQPPVSPTPTGPQPSPTPTPTGPQPSPTPTGPVSSSSLGYAPDFLGPRVVLPQLTDVSREQAFLLQGSEVIPYTHFSLALHKERKMALWVAWNIDGGNLKKISRPKKFKYDPRIPQQFQAGESLYANNPLDRGHIARRADLLWGSDKEARKANTDSFFFPNIAPQMDSYNQSGKDGIWGQLEDAVFAEVDVQNLRVSVFGGPVFQDDDQMYRGFRIPRSFFKVLVFLEDDNLKARAFLLSQNLNELERLTLDPFRAYQVSLGDIEQRCHFSFPDVLKHADSPPESLRIQPETAIPQPLRSLRDISW